MQAPFFLRTIYIAKGCIALAWVSSPILDVWRTWRRAIKKSVAGPRMVKRKKTKAAIKSEPGETGAPVPVSPGSLCRFFPPSESLEQARYETALISSFCAIYWIIDSPRRRKSAQTTYKQGQIYLGNRQTGQLAHLCAGESVNRVGTDLQRELAAIKHLHRGTTRVTTCVALPVHCQVKKVHPPNLFKEKCISEVVRIGSIIIFNLSKLWRALALSERWKLWNAIKKWLADLSRDSSSSFTLTKG